MWTLPVTLGKSSPLACAFFRSRRYQTSSRAKTHQRPNGAFHGVSKEKARPASR